MRFQHGIQPKTTTNCLRFSDADFNTFQLFSTSLDAGQGAAAGVMNVPDLWPSLGEEGGSIFPVRGGGYGCRVHIHAL